MWMGGGGKASFKRGAQKASKHKRLRGRGPCRTSRFSKLKLSTESRGAGGGTSRFCSTSQRSMEMWGPALPRLSSRSRRKFW